MSDPTTSAESLEYRTEVKQLLDILAHSLYTDREIFLRELISNASDALNRVQFEMLTNPGVFDAERELAIRIEVDPHAKIITISDSGIGMNREELIRNLGTIAHSGAKAFLQHAGTNGDGKGADAGAENGESGRKRTLEEIIGQFGVGFYSVFMVAAEVIVTSRSYRPDDSAWTWRSRGDSTFQIEPGQRSERGTTFQILLKEDASEFASGWRLEQIVKKHSDYVSFPIYVSATDGEAKIANRRTALWRQSPSSVEAGQYAEFYKQLTFDTEDPLLHIHMVTDAPVNLRTVLFVPAQRERGAMGMRPDHGLRLYSRKILIQERNKDLLPDFLRFVDGVVDSEDLPLNVSRETVQSNPAIRQMKRALTGRLLRELKSLAENSAEKYLKFWEEFGVFLKEGTATDTTSQDSLIELLRFKSSRSEDEWVSLQSYIDRMADDQKAIYYVLGEDLKSVRRSPHLDYFRARNLEVLYLVDPIDGFMTAMLREAHGKPLQNVDDAGLELPQGDEKPEDAAATETPSGEFAALVERFKTVLGDRVRDVQESKQLVASPGRLVSPEDSYDRDLQRIRRLTEENYEAPKKLLELNRKHPLIINLAKILAATPDEPLVDASIEQLFDNLLLLEGLHNSPADMVERIQLLMEAAVSTRVGK